MRIPRLHLVQDNCYVHMFWRCHNKSMLLAPREVKDLILKLYYEQTPRFGIRIVDHQILDNHAHFIVKAPNAKALGDFARKVHTKLAIFINKFFGRDSQVFRDRYHSPRVDSDSYFVNLIQYVWLNRLKINPKLRPENDPYCSAFHRLRRTKYGKQLLSYSEAGLCSKKEEDSFFRRLLEDCVKSFKEKILSLARETFENRYFIGPVNDLMRMRESILKILKQKKLVNV